MGFFNGDPDSVKLVIARHGTKTLSFCILLVPDVWGLTYYMVTLHNIIVARGQSGRIVLEIDPSEKDELYNALAKDGLTLKNWFLLQASRYLQERAQLSLFGAVAESYPPYDRAKTSASGKEKSSTTGREQT